MVLENKTACESSYLFFKGMLIDSEEFARCYDVVYVPISPFHDIYSAQNPHHHIHPDHHDQANEERIHAIEEGLTAGNPLNIPVLGENTNHFCVVESGRHRMAALKRLGIEEVPVLVIKQHAVEQRHFTTGDGEKLAASTGERVAESYGGRVASPDEVAALYDSSKTIHAKEIAKQSEEIASALRLDGAFYQKRKMQLHLADSGNSFPAQEDAKCLHFFNEGDTIIVEATGERFTRREILRSEYAACYTGDLECEYRQYGGREPAHGAPFRFEIPRNSNTSYQILERALREQGIIISQGGELTTVGVDLEDVTKALDNVARYYDFNEDLGYHRDIRDFRPFLDALPGWLRDKVMTHGSIIQSCNNNKEDILTHDDVNWDRLLQALPHLRSRLEQALTQLNQHSVFVANDHERPSPGDLRGKLPNIAESSFDGFIQKMYAAQGGLQRQVYAFMQAFGFGKDYRAAFPYIFASFGQDLAETLKAIGTDTKVFLEVVPLEDISRYTGLALPEILSQLGYQGADGVERFVEQIHGGKWDIFLKPNYGNDLASFRYEFGFDQSDMVRFTISACLQAGGNAKSVAEILPQLWGDEKPLAAFVEAARLNHPAGVAETLELLGLKPTEPEVLTARFGNGNPLAIAELFGLRVERPSHLPELVGLAGSIQALTKAVGARELLGHIGLDAMLNALQMNETGLIRALECKSLHDVAQRHYSGNLEATFNDFGVHTFKDLCNSLRFTPDIIANTVHSLAQDVYGRTAVLQSLIGGEAQSTVANHIFNHCFMIEDADAMPPLDRQAISRMVDSLEKIFGVGAVASIKETYSHLLGKAAADAQVEAFGSYIKNVIADNSLNVARNVEQSEDVVSFAVPAQRVGMLMVTLQQKGFHPLQMKAHDDTAITIRVSDLMEHDFDAMTQALAGERKALKEILRGPRYPPPAQLLDQCLAPPFFGDFGAIVAATGSKYSIRDALVGVIDKIPPEHFGSLMEHVFPNNFDSFRGYRESAGIEYSPEGFKKLMACTGLKPGEVQGLFFSSNAHGNVVARFKLDARNPVHAAWIHDVYNTPEIQNPVWPKHQLEGGFAEYIRDQGESLNGKEYKAFITEVLQSNGGVKGIAERFYNGDVDATLGILTNSYKRTSLLRDVYGVMLADPAHTDWERLVQDAGVSAAQASVQPLLANLIYHEEAPRMIRHVYGGDIQAFLTAITTKPSSVMFPSEALDDKLQVVLQYSFPEIEAPTFSMLIEAIYPEGRAFAMKHAGIDLAKEGPSLLARATRYYDGNLEALLSEQASALLQWSLVHPEHGGVAALVKHIQAMIPETQLPFIIDHLGGVRTIIDRFFPDTGEVGLVEALQAVGFEQEALMLEGISLQTRFAMRGPSNVNFDKQELAQLFDLPVNDLETMLASAFGGRWDIGLVVEAGTHHLQATINIPDHVNLRFMYPDTETEAAKIDLAKTLQTTLESFPKRELFEQLQSRLKSAAQTHENYKTAIQNTIPALNILANGTIYEHGSYIPASTTIHYDHSQGALVKSAAQKEKQFATLPEEQLQQLLQALNRATQPNQVTAILQTEVQNHIRTLDTLTKQLETKQRAIKAQQSIVEDATQTLATLDASITRHTKEMQQYQSAHYTLPQPPHRPREEIVQKRDASHMLTEALQVTKTIGKIDGQIEPFRESYGSTERNVYKIVSKRHGLRGRGDPQIDNAVLDELRTAITKQMPDSGEGFGEYIFRRSKRDESVIYFNPTVISHIYEVEKDHERTRVDSLHGSNLLQYILKNLRDHNFGDDTRAVNQPGLTAVDMQQASRALNGLTNSPSVQNVNGSWQIQAGTATSAIRTILEKLSSPSIHVETRGGVLVINQNQLYRLEKGATEFERAWQQVNRNYSATRYEQEHITPLKDPVNKSHAEREQAKTRITALSDEVVDLIKPATQPFEKDTVKLIETCISENRRLAEALRVQT